ncbi:hypothetical protein GCM10023323_45630 [Streptomyces thinghirensis]|uniref:Uncharacterized protein n=1 Tax=Streptomyces thinghirensis TaxID=551547 RepID=A0ABP9T6G4_9ACTN
MHGRLIGRGLVIGYRLVIGHGRLMRRGLMRHGSSWGTRSVRRPD